MGGRGKTDQYLRAQRDLVAKFGETWNMRHIYQFCFGIYKTRRDLHEKQGGLFSGIHLLHSRALLQQKEGLFIKDWSRLILSHQPLYSYVSHAQELITLLEIMEQRHNQASLLLNFLKEYTVHSWSSLQDIAVGQLDVLRAALMPIVQNIMENNKKSSAINANKIGMTIEEQAIQEAEMASNGSGKERLHIAKSFYPPKQPSKGPYQVSSIKLFVKQKPTAVKLLTKQEVLSLRKKINSRQKSTNMRAPMTEACKEKTEASEKATECKKSQNYNTYHTEISEDSEESSSQQRSESKSNMQKVKQGNSRFAVAKHHKSNFQDPRHLKKLLQGKEAFKSNSIHKIEGINSLAKYHKAIEEPPSRNTIETSSINRFASEHPAEPHRQRNNKISIVSKLQRTIKKIQLKNLKRPRGGMYITDEKLKEIGEMYSNARKTEENQHAQSDRSGSHSHSRSQSFSSNGNNQGEKKSILKPDKRVSQFIEIASQKEHQRNKRRFGISTKVLKSNKTIEWGSMLIKNASEKKKHSDVISRTSIFRSSGSNFQEKKSNVRSKYNQNYESHKRMKLNKSQVQFLDEKDRHQLENTPKKYAFSKKANPKEVNWPQASSIQLNALISTHDMTKLISQIHQQDKLDRQGHQKEYYSEVMRKKYESSSQFSYDQSDGRQNKMVKIQSRIEVIPPRKTKYQNKQEMLLQFMIKTVKANCEISLDQTGFYPSNMQGNSI